MASSDKSARKRILQDPSPPPQATRARLTDSTVLRSAERGASTPDGEAPRMSTQGAPLGIINVPKWNICEGATMAGPKVAKATS